MSLITIDQLLESVDLDFEPRWVTKDEDGCITIWEQKPETKDDIWIAQCSLFALRAIKLSNFADKDWQECIYEVPRKTTGKIEKLETQEISHGGENMVLHIQKIPATAEEMHKKINELVDAVNKHADIIRQIGQWGSSKGEFLWCETLTKFEPDELKGAK